jgi:hypothetical protein
VTALHVGDRVWVGAEANPVPAHILSIHPRINGIAEYVVRTLDLDGGPGQNLNMRIHTSAVERWVRPRGSGELTPPAPRDVAGPEL